MFPYYGEIVELSEVLNRNRERLRRVYKDVLGAEMFQRIEEADARFLDAVAFSSIETAEWFSGMRLTTRNNKFFIALHTKGRVLFSEDGHFSNMEVAVAPGFIFTQEGFVATRQNYHGWVSPYLAPYIHEYNHFVLFALQAAPMLTAIVILESVIRPKRWPLDLLDIEPLVLEGGGTLEEQRLRAILAVWGWLIEQTYEISTRVLDSQIFKRLGYRVPQYYFNIPSKHFVPFPLNFIKTVLIIPVGDVLRGTSVRERLRLLGGWVEKFNPSHSLQANFMESFKSLQINKVSFRELLGLYGLYG